MQLTPQQKLSFKKSTLALSVTASLVLAACSSSDNDNDSADLDTGGDVAVGGGGDVTTGAAGGVFAMSNLLDENTIVAYSRADDGTLNFVGEFATEGQGGDFDGPEGLDPLISAYALINTPDNEYLMAANAGSNTISVLAINDDMSLEVTDVVDSRGVGPNSLAYHDGIVYVTNIDADGEFAGEPDQEGSIYGYTFDADTGSLTPIPGSLRQLENRPAAIRFTPDGEYLAITSINAGSAALASGNDDSIVVFGLDENGAPSAEPTAGATSTPRGNSEGRNLPSAIGFEIVDRSNGTFAIVTEAREFRAEGEPPTFPGLQTGSVSVYQIGEGGTLAPSQLDLFAGQSPTVGQRTACWIVMSPDGEYFWVSNALDASISSYRFTDDSGNIELVQELAAIGNQPTSPDPAVAFATSDGWIDLDISDDGEYIYQLFGLTGEIGVYAVDGGNLTLVETVGGDLPEQNTQGIISF